MRVQDVIEFVSLHVPFVYFANEFPESAKDNCGVIRVEGGGQPDMYVVGMNSPSIQVLIRHNKASEAEQMSQDVWKLFHGKSHFPIGETTVHFAKCDQSEPVFVLKDKNERTIYSVNVSCKTTE